MMTYFGFFVCIVCSKVRRYTAYFVWSCPVIILNLFLFSLSSSSVPYSDCPFTLSVYPRLFPSVPKFIHPQRCYRVNVWRWWSLSSILIWFFQFLCLLSAQVLIYSFSLSLSNCFPNFFIRNEWQSSSDALWRFLFVFTT